MHIRFDFSSIFSILSVTHVMCDLSLCNLTMAHESNLSRKLSVKNIFDSKKGNS